MLRRFSSQEYDYLGQMRHDVEESIAGFAKIDARQGRSFCQMVSSKPSMMRVYRDIAKLSGVGGHPHPFVLDIGGGGGVLGEAIQGLRVGKPFDYVVLDNSKKELEHARMRFNGVKGVRVTCKPGDRMDLSEFQGKADYSFLVLPVKNETLQKALVAEFHQLKKAIDVRDLHLIDSTKNLMIAFTGIIDAEKDLLFFEALRSVKPGGVFVWAELSPKDNPWISDLARLGPKLGFKPEVISNVTLGDDNRNLFRAYYDEETSDPLVFVVRKTDDRLVQDEYKANLARDAQRWEIVASEKRMRDALIPPGSGIKNLLLDDLMRKRMQNQK